MSTADWIGTAPDDDCAGTDVAWSASKTLAAEAMRIFFIRKSPWMLGRSATFLSCTTEKRALLAGAQRRPRRGKQIGLHDDPWLALLEDRFRKEEARFILMLFLSRKLIGRGEAWERRSWLFG